MAALRGDISFRCLKQFFLVNYIFTDYVRILYLSGNVKKSKISAKLAETSIVKIVFNGLLCDVSTYTVTVSFCRST
jgi:hypothetical protein